MVSQDIHFFIKVFFELLENQMDSQGNDIFLFEKSFPYYQSMIGKIPRRR
jgi:hypothetical protein